MLNWLFRRNRDIKKETTIQNESKNEIKSESKIRDMQIERQAEDIPGNINFEEYFKKYYPLAYNTLSMQAFVQGASLEDYTLDIVKRFKGEFELSDDLMGAYLIHIAKGNIKGINLNKAIIDNMNNYNFSQEFINDLRRNSLLTRIEEAKSKLRMSVETKSDEVTLVPIIEGAKHFTNILYSIDTRNRCINYNSKGLVVLAGFINAYYDSEDLKKALYSFSNNITSWGEFVQFMHKFSSLIELSDSFYDNCLEYIELVLELNDIEQIL